MAYDIYFYPHLQGWKISPPYPAKNVAFHVKIVPKSLKVGDTYAIISHLVVSVDDNDRETALRKGKEAIRIYWDAPSDKLIEDSYIFEEYIEPPKEKQTRQLVIFKRETST